MVRSTTTRFTGVGYFTVASITRYVQPDLPYRPHKYIHIDFYNDALTIKFQTDGSEDDKSPMPRKVPYGLERVLMPHNTAPNDRSVQTPRNEGLAQCYFEVRHATCVVSVAEAYRLLQEMME